MSKCDVELVLERPGPFAGGDELTGFVGLTVNKSCRRALLTVYLEWMTHGRGTRDKEHVQSSVLYQGPLNEGERGLYPFSIIVPNGPFSYNGGVVSVQWQVRAHVDIPWAFDPNAMTVVTVVPGPLQLSTPSIGTQAQMPPSMGRLGSVIMKVMTGVVFTTLGLVFMLVFGIIGLSMTWNGEIVFGMIGIGVPLVFVTVGAKMLMGLLSKVRMHRRIGGLSLTVPERAAPGQALPVTVRFTPRADERIREVCIDAECREVAVSGSGTKHRTHVSSAWRGSQVIATPGTVGGGVEVSVSGDFELPDLPLYSFSASNNQVRWEIVAKVILDSGQSVECAELLILGPV